MSYIGNTPTQQNFVAGADQFSGTGSQTVFTLSRNVNTVFDIFVTVANVPQDPFTAYTVSGNTLTFDGAPPSGTNNIDVVYRATNVQTFVPTPGVSTQLGLGSASAPSLTFIGDTNTGIYSPAADTIAFTEGGTEVARFNSAGNFGLGTSSPNQRLQINNPAASSSLASFTNANTGSAGGDGSYCGIDTTGNMYVWNQENLPILFGTNNGERMRIDSAGNVGIGTSSPGARLQVTDGNFSQLYLNSTTTVAGIRFGNTGSTNGYIYYDNGANLTFQTNGSERARITSGGNFGVGTTIPGTNYGELVNFTSGTASQPSLTLLNTNASFSNDVFQLRCANTAANGNSWNMITGFSSTSTLNFLVRGSGNVQNTNNSYGAISDERLKENIVDATPKLEKLNQVRIVNFNLKGEEHKQIGVVAQELEQVFPGMIEENQDGMKGVKYSVFVPMLIKAIQEQQAMIDELKAEVAALKGAA